MPKEIIVNWERLPQTRRNPLTGDSVIISAQRGLRKRKEAEVAAYPSDLPKILDSCPFCPGNEEETPQELVRVPDGSTDKWLVRGFANLFPFLMIEAKKARSNSEFFEKFLESSVGQHEIIVESAKHNQCMSFMTEIEIVAIFEGLRQRYYALKELPDMKFFYAFKNYGPGASQDHPHWQLEAREFGPKTIFEKCQNMSRYKLETGRCLLCDVLREEKENGRMVLETDHFICCVPWAPSEPHELIFASKDHSSCFADYLNGQKIACEFASILKEGMLRVKMALQGDNWQRLSDPSYLFCLYTAPFNDDKDGYYHWHLSFLPRTTDKVGHERGTGEDVISEFPERIAEVLRNIKGD